MFLSEKTGGGPEAHAPILDRRTIVKLKGYATFTGCPAVVAWNGHPGGETLISPAAINKAASKRTLDDKQRPGAASFADRETTAADHCPGVRRSAAGPRALDRAAGGRTSRQATIGPARRQRNPSASCR